MEGLAVTPSFWKGRRVFVTGHTGFKGAWLCVWLHRLGAHVTGFALEPQTQPNLYEAVRLGELVASRLGDVRDCAELTARVAEHKPDVVFHLAAQSLVRRSYESPLLTYETNVGGAANILEAVRVTPGVRAAIIVTSDKCYDLQAGKERYREDDALGGHDPYSASKAAAEIVTAAYRSSFWGGPGSPVVATVRSGNVIGGGDWSRDRLVPDLVSAFSDRRLARIRQPESVRPWQHVLDPLRGYLMLAEKLASSSAADFAGAWNFGPPTTGEWRVQAMAEEVARAWGAGAAWTTDERPHPHEAPALRLNSDKAREKLGWRSNIPLSLAIERTVRWYRAFADGADARQLTYADLDELTMQAVGS